MTLDEIRSFLDQEYPCPDVSGAVAVDRYLDVDSNDHEGHILHANMSVGDQSSNNLICTRQCDRLWGEFNYRLLAFIRDAEYSEKQLAEVLSSVQLDDSHWCWLEKSSHYKGSEYDWFFLVIDGEVQAACLIYHPKPSAIDRADIFYIEYVAVAPWNRENPMAERRFPGIGSVLIKYAVNYSVKNLGLRPGFSLHSLQRAEGYYNKIGMIHFPELEKCSMKYFELPEFSASELIGGCGG